MIKAPSAAKIAVKVILALILTTFILQLIVFTIEAVSTDMYGVTDAELVSWCEDDYYARDFSRLYETLTLYDLYDLETYGVYWEAVEGCNLLAEYETWANASDTARADAALAALEALAANPTHERNRALLEALLAEATAE